MKRIFLLLIALLAINTQLFAESDVLRWGITGGVNITKAKKDGGTYGTGWDFDATSGFYAGFIARLSLPILGFGLDGSLLYSQEAVSVAGTTSGTQEKTTTDRLRFISIPVHLRYDLEIAAVRNIVIPFAFAGPQWNLAMNNFNWENPQSGENWETNRQTWKFDLGFGAILFNHLQVSYNYAIPLNETFSVSSSTYNDVKNNYELGTHRIGLAYFF